MFGAVRTAQVQESGINVVGAAQRVTEPEALNDSNEATGESLKEPGQFVICLIKRRSEEPGAFSAFVKSFEHSFRCHGGKVQVKHKEPKEWAVHDGHEHFEAKSHLEPARFEFDCLIVGVFSSVDDIHIWWASDEVFDVLAGRSRAVEKMGIHSVAGLLPGFDIFDEEKVHFSEKFMLLDIMKVKNFKAMQRYIVDFRACAKAEALEATRGQGTQYIGYVKVLFADRIANTFIDEIPVDIATATMWRYKEDAVVFHESENYQGMVRPFQQKHSDMLALTVPLSSDQRLPPERRKDRPSSQPRHTPSTRAHSTN